MAGITDQGLVIKTLPEIINSLTTKLQDRYGDSFSVGTNTPEGVIVGIVSAAISDNWMGIQGAYDAAYARTATERNLDNVSDRVNIRRIAAAKSYTPIEFTGTVGSVIVAETVVVGEEVEGRFLVSDTLTLSSSQFSDVTLSVTTVADSTNYSVTIDGEIATINSGVSATANSILVALQSEIESTLSGLETSLPTSTNLRINVTQPNSVLPLIVGSGLSVVSVSDIVVAEAEDTGAVLAPLGKLNETLIPIAGITAVTNLQSAVVGRERETDEELRVRRFSSVGATSTSTYNAMLAKISNISGVEFSFVIANTGASTNSEGVPSKAFEVVVLGGNEDEIAETIFANAPIAIETYGAITKVVTDTEGNPQTVKFSRPTNVFIHVHCTYTDYVEEVVSATNAAAIRSSIVDYGNDLPSGGDIIPERFFGSIYSNSSGVGKVSITVAKSYDGITPITPFTSNTLPISKRELPVFRSSSTVVTKT